MSYILKTSQLTKVMGDRELVKNVNIHVKRGEIYGFCGPNGAGKTTVMKMIMNLWKPTSGTIEIFGEQLTTKSYEILKRMAGIIDFPYFYGHLSGKENLRIHCEYMGYHDSGGAEEALEMLGLGDAAEKLVRNYSLGMKQRLGIARAILCKPELLLLDEPTNGLDPAGMKLVRDLFKKLCTDYGITIIFSSHILSEVESIANTIGLINHGKMIKEISMREIYDSDTAYFEIVVEDVKKAVSVLADKLNPKKVEIADERNIRIYDNKITSKEILKVFALNDIEIMAISRQTENLEDYFLKMTGKEDN